MEPAIHIHHISKRYGNVLALDAISLEVERGELFGLIGPDGAGKTTLFRILTSLLLPDGGTARLEGFDVVRDFRAIRKIVGYMPGRFSLYYDLSVEENLRFFATIFGTTIEENYHLIKDIYGQIEPFRNRKAGKLSGGMKQKLALSCALIHKPDVLILDEPTTGVDAVSRKEFWEVLRQLKEQGITIIVSTPYMDEAGQCDRVGLIQKGRIMDIDTPQAIVEKYEHHLVGITASDMYRLLKDLATMEGVISAHRFGDSIHVALPGPGRADALVNELEGLRHSGVRLEPIEPNIEDCFMQLMTLNHD